MNLIHPIEYWKKLNRPSLLSKIEVYTRFDNYIQLIDQELKPEMFVPMKDGKVLSEPYVDSDLPKPTHSRSILDHKEAQAKLIFEGFKVFQTILSDTIAVKFYDVEIWFYADINKTKVYSEKKSKQITKVSDLCGMGLTIKEK